MVQTHCNFATLKPAWVGRIYFSLRNSHPLGLSAIAKLQSPIADLQWGLTINQAYNYVLRYFGSAITRCRLHDWHGLCSIKG